MKNFRILSVLLGSAIFAFSSACNSYPKIERNEALNSKDSVICVSAEIALNTKISPPKNASKYRSIAKMYPMDGKFGPPPSQQNLPNSKWDLSNEFWYLTETGELFLYSNSDDGYVYYWQFSTVPKANLEKHGLLYCAE